MQDDARWCNTMQYHGIPCDTMKYHAIPGDTMRYHAMPCNSMQYHAIPCNTIQYPAPVITADGADHCPVGSMRPFLQSKVFLWLVQMQLQSVSELGVHLYGRWGNRGAGWLHLPTLRLPQLRLLPMFQQILFIHWYVSPFKCMFFFKTIDGANVSLTFYLWF